MNDDKAQPLDNWITRTTGSCNDQTIKVTVTNFRPKFNVIATDIRIPPNKMQNFSFLDVTDERSIEQIVVNENISVVVHFSALLSAIGEKNPDLALRVNVDGFQNVLNVAKRHNLKVFCPSTIGAFGPTTPKTAKDLTVMRPTTIYGITKLHNELMGEVLFANSSITVIDTASISDLFDYQVLFLLAYPVAVLLTMRSIFSIP